MDSEYSVVTSGPVSDAPVLDGLVLEVLEVLDGLVPDGLVAVMPFKLRHGGVCGAGLEKPGARQVHQGKQ